MYSPSQEVVKFHISKERALNKDALQRHIYGLNHLYTSSLITFNLQGISSLACKPFHQLWRYVWPLRLVLVENKYLNGLLKHREQRHTGTCLTYLSVRNGFMSAFYDELFLKGIPSLILMHGWKEANTKPANILLLNQNWNINE